MYKKTKASAKKMGTKKNPWPAVGRMVSWDAKKQGPSKVNKGFGRP